MSTTTPPASLIPATAQTLSNYLFDILAMGEGILHGTHLDWAVQAFRNLMARNGQAYREAPASSSLGRHHCFDGGLMYHSLEVYFIAHRLWVGAEGSITRNENASLWTACLLHDFNKCCDPMGRPAYIPNILKGDKQSDRKPFKHNQEFLGINPEVVTHSQLREVISGPERQMLQLAAEILSTESGRIAEGKISRLMACVMEPAFRQLPPEVVQAIHYHDGGYGQGRYELSGNEEKITIYVHAADMISSRFELQYPIDPIRSMRERLTASIDEPGRRQEVLESPHPAG